MREKPAFSLPGGPMFLLLIVAVAATVFVLISSSQMQATVGVAVAMFALAAALVSQAALWADGSPLTLPFSIVLIGGLLALILTYAIRLLFQPPSKSQQGPI